MGEYFDKLSEQIEMAIKAEEERLKINGDSLRVTKMEIPTFVLSPLCRKLQIQAANGLAQEIEKCISHKQEG